MGEAAYNENHDRAGEIRVLSKSKVESFAALSKLPRNKIVYTHPFLVLV